jgi:YVTN family beta-propeller protein
MPSPSEARRRWLSSYAGAPCRNTATFAGQVNGNRIDLRHGLLITLLVATGLATSGSVWARTDAGGRSERMLAAPTASPALHKYEYVFVDGTIFIYDIGNRHRLVTTIALPQLQGIRGVAGSARTHMLFISFGPDSDAGRGHLLKFDLVAGQVAWDRTYPFGIDSMAISKDGNRIYMPTGENSNGGAWKVLEARNGDVIATIPGGRGPHNTVVGLSGRWVYMGPRKDDYLYVASTRTNRIVRKVGPLVSGVRPFTVNRRETIAYTTATGFLGFQVGDLKTGRVLYTVPVKGFPWNPSTFAPSAPSHGIALSPDGKRLWVLDSPSSYVHAFDVSRVPAKPPRQVANVPLSQPMVGNESPCLYDCLRDGWLQLSRDGRYLYVGDSGDVIDTRTRQVVAQLPAMRNTRKTLEIWWRNGRPVFVGRRTSIGLTAATSRQG